MSPDRQPHWSEYGPRLPGSGPWRPGGRRPFGETWWGRAWVQALEQRASLDPSRLPRGRTYARTGAVDRLRLAPGRVTAKVQGSRRTPYRVEVAVRAFTDGEWEAVLRCLGEQIGHTAALLDGELPAEVADDARRAGSDLLPGPGDLRPHCTCPDWADPCKHAAAVCYLVADALDEDPFGVLLLRGRRREQVLEALRRGRRRRTDRPRANGPGGRRSAPEGSDAGIPARAAWARRPAPLPPLPSPPARPGRPTVLAPEPPPQLGVDVWVLSALAADAAVRAHGLVLDRGQGGWELDADEDLARRVADPAPTTSPTELARAAGIPTAQLLQRATAWRQGGRIGLRTLLETWDPPRSALEEGVTLLGTGAAGPAGRRGASIRHNRVTAGDRQLRLGADGRWYPYRRRGRSWEPDGRPLDPVEGNDEEGELG